jgi:FtsZ-binding cell division protein ZapB
MTDANDHFQMLEEKLFKAAEVFRRTQQEKHALHQEVEKLRADAQERARRCEALERELIALRKEREDVRTRVERLLEQIDALTKTDSGG